MAQAKQSRKAIATLGEKWQSFATSKLQQHQPQQQSFLFRENLLKKVTNLLHKWQIDTNSDLPPLQSQFATQIQQKYLTHLNKFQRQQHQPNLLEETTNNQEWWLDFDWLSSPSPQFNQSILSGERLGESSEKYISPPQQSPIVKRLQKTTFSGQTQPSLTTINRQILLNQKPLQLVNDINHKYSRVNYQPETNLLKQKKSVISSAESSNIINQQIAQEELKNQIEQSSYSNISQQLRSFLGNILNLRVPNVKVYSNQAANNYVKKLNADAITYEDKVLLKTGKYNPQKPESIALIGHEITHAANLTPQRQSYRSPHSNAAEEQAALINEKKVLNYFSLPGATISSPQPSIPISNISPSTNFNQALSSTPKTAPEGRLNGSKTETSSPTFELSDIQIHRIAEQVEPIIYTKIYKHIQEDFERGG
ncbi:hypothetical protein AMR41_08670 [Hapalosiphon sp. MRB220]|nr:hypothetical protein AMR41_08670 [Hapalosiphon sp. MRB220]